MNILRVQDNKLYKLAWEHNLQLCGVEDGNPQWIGNSFQLDLVWEALQRNNLI